MEEDDEIVCECGSKEFTELGWMGKTQHLRCRKCGLDIALVWSLEEAKPKLTEEEEQEANEVL